MSAAVTVAVVSWNTCDLLARCLRSLEPEQRAGRADVWVIDNASSDGSAELVANDFPWASLIASSENLGFGPAVNAVAAKARRAEWLVAANADVALEPGALAVLIAAGERDLRAGLVAPRLVLEDGTTQHSVHAFPTPLTAALLAAGAGRLSSKLADRLCVVGRWDAARRRRVDWAHGALLLMRRAAFDEIGGFDERQWMYAEDLDVAWRMRHAGWYTRYEPGAAVLHTASAATAKAWGDERSRRSMAATYDWIARRRGSAVARVVAALNFMGAAARAALAAGEERERQLWHLRLHREGLRRGRGRRLARGRVRLSSAASWSRRDPSARSSKGRVDS
jgi:N-acetylglucosaminyl-diphospho-decaprenol L-rhamnosyltransferase